jgi:hypothetical protein
MLTPTIPSLLQPRLNTIDVCLTGVHARDVASCPPTSYICVRDEINTAEVALRPHQSGCMKRNATAYHMLSDLVHQYFREAVTRSDEMDRQVAENYSKG